MKPNVLLVVLDSVRARNTSLHGYHRETTPFLERFANTSTQYTQARAPGIWSLPSHISIFTGYQVEEHRITAAAEDETTGAILPKHALTPGHTIWELLRSEHGYTTGVFSSNPFLTELPVGIKQSFDEVQSNPSELPFDGLDPRSFSTANAGLRRYLHYVGQALNSNQPLGTLLNGFSLVASSAPSRSANTYLSAFESWIEELNGPWAACVNLMDAHYPYNPASEHDNWGREEVHRLQESMDSAQTWEFYGRARPWWHREALTDLYDGTIRQLDAALQRLVSHLMEQGELSNTLLVITSDHGEGFGEPSELLPGHRMAAHVLGVDETLLHVPLIVKYPNQSTGNTVMDPVSVSQFPEVVKGVLHGNRKSFLSNEPVVSSSKFGDIRRERASKHCDDTAPFEGWARAVYSCNESDNVIKHAAWQEQMGTFRVDDAQTTVKLDSEGEVEVTTAFENITDAGIREVLTQSSQSDDDVQQRLQDLGYA